MDKQAGFQDLQQTLASHLREPQQHPAPAGADEKRIAVYRRLFFKNIAGFIARAFPVLRSLHGEDDWQKLLRRFYACHHCRTPYFRRIPKEFVDYLGKERDRRKLDPPYLHELAHYEWVELSLATAEEPERVPAIDPLGDLLKGRPVANPVMRCLSYRWPVHAISPDCRPQEADARPYHYVVYRDADYRVRFLRLNQTANLVINSIRKCPQRQGHQHIEEALRQSGFSESDSELSPLLEKGHLPLKQLREKNVLPGSRLNPADTFGPSGSGKRGFCREAA